MAVTVSRTGAPRGETRTDSAISAYRVDPETLTATEVWNSTTASRCTPITAARGCNTSWSAVPIPLDDMNFL
jgi:hypothetical protein